MRGGVYPGLLVPQTFIVLIEVGSALIGGQRLRPAGNGTSAHSPSTVWGGVPGQSQSAH